METFPFLSFASWTHESWLWENLHHALYSDSVVCPGLKRIIGTVTKSSFHYSNQLLRGGEEYGKISGFHEHGPTITLIHFSDCEVNALIQSNTIWNTVLMDKAFYNSHRSYFWKKHDTQ